MNIKITINESTHIIEIKFDDSTIREFILEKELKENKIRFVSNGVTNQQIRTTAITKNDSKKERYETGYEDVKELFVQQTKIIRDRYKTRWVKCEKCGAIKQDVEFTFYGGENHVNLGICKECSMKQK